MTKLTSADVALNNKAIENPNQITVTLLEGFERGTETIKEITLTKPRAGALRGLNLADVLQLNVNAIIKLLPRISQPMLTESDLLNFDPADFTELSSTLISFFVDQTKKSQLT